MKLSLTNRIGAIVAASMIITLSIMIVILLSQEHDQLIKKTEENALGLTGSLLEGVVTAMDAGTSDVKPLINKLKNVDNVAELKFKTSPSFISGRSDNFDADELKVMNSGRRTIKEESINGISSMRVIEAVKAGASCTGCHSGIREGQTLAVIDLYYSMEKTEEFLARQKIQALIMAVVTILITYLVIMFFIRRKVLRFILISIERIRDIARGISELTAGIDQLSKGNLNSEISIKAEKLDFKVNNELDELASDVNSMIENYELAAKSFSGTKKELSRLISETRKLTAAAAAGDLDNRGNERQFEGVYKELLAGINNTLDAISVPVKKGADILQTLASGNFTVRMTGEYKGINQLIQSSINTLAVSLNNALLEVTEAVQATASAAHEISASSEQMASGLQDQSEKTSGIVVAIDEITQAILDGTHNTSEASQNSRLANENALKGADKIHETREGMLKIFESTKNTSGKILQLAMKTEQIGELAMTINEIADQTNLLALNAAIEAARAGEQGRGFSVVADEVRKLAERTAKATHEITDTINHIQTGTRDVDQSMKYTEEKVNEGMHMMDDVSEVLKEILYVSNNVNGIMEGLNTKSREQSYAAEQISSSIGGISSIAEQSAAGTMQMAKAAEDLTRLTIVLQKLVSRFQLNGEIRRKISVDSAVMPG